MEVTQVYVIVYINEGMSQGMVYMTRKLKDNETLEEQRFADQVADNFATELIAAEDSLNIGGDIRVEFTDHKPKTRTDKDGNRWYLGSTVIWSGQSFYFKREA